MKAWQIVRDKPVFPCPTVSSVTSHVNCRGPMRINKFKKLNLNWLVQNVIKVTHFLDPLLDASL